MAPVTSTPAPYRLLRGVLVAGAGLMIATAGHVAAGGSARPGALSLPVALLVVAACVTASHRAWTLGRLVGILAGIQVVTHLALLLSTPSGAVDPRLAQVATRHVHEHVHGLTPGMLVAHAAAVVVAALVLARVDVAATLLWHLAARLLPPALVRCAARAVSVVLPVGEHLRPVHELTTPSGASRRGPPSVLARA